MKKSAILCACLIFSSSAVRAEVDVPEAIKVAEGYVKQLTLHAMGEQIYHCVSKQGQYHWKWHAPEAKLYDSKTQEVVGKHGAGPHWHYKDGSGVKAKAVQKVDAPEQAAAQWLLLAAIAHDGKGLLTETAYIQRINTQGGLAPVQPCDGNHLGSEIKIPYTADYVFFK